MQEGNIEARNKLIEHNLRLVAHIAKKYENTFEDKDDILSIGIIGLIKAVDSFNVKATNKLATYAAKCIENEILMHLRSNKNKRNYTWLSTPIGLDKDGNETLVGEFVLKNIIYVKEITYEGVPGDGNYQLVKVTGAYKEGYDKDTFVSYLTWDDIEFIKEAETELLILEKQGLLTDEQKFSVNNPTVISTFNWMSLISLIFVNIL